MEELKEKLVRMYNDNYYLLLSLSLFVIVGVVAIIWTLYSQSVANRFNVNNVSGLEDIEYTAVYYEEVEQPYVTVEAEDMEDIHLVKIQSALFKNNQDSVPVYWVRDSDAFLPTNSFYQDGLYKKVQMVDNALHEVTKYEHLYVSETEPNKVNQWDIHTGAFNNGVYKVEGELSPDANSLEKYSQLKALSEMIRSINKENEKITGVPLLLEFETGDDKVLYHTDYDDVLGKSSLYQSKKIEP